MTREQRKTIEEIRFGIETSVTGELEEIKARLINSLERNTKVEVEFQRDWSEVGRMYMTISMISEELERRNDK